jgi:hypothetical protein
LSLRRALLAAALPLPAGAYAAITVPASADSAPAPDKALIQELDPKVAQDGEERTTDLTLGYSTSRRQTTTRIHHPGATYIKVHFTAFRLAAGDRVTVADPTGREVYTYRGDPTANAVGSSDFTIHRTRGFAAMSVDGDTAVVTLHRAGSVSGRGYGVRIDRFWRGFSAAEIAARPAPASVCGPEGRRDSVCYQTSFPTEYGRARAVARLRMGGGYCTAWRVGNTNRLLTNNHCMSTAAAVRASEVQFDYACATCGGNDAKPAVKVSGAELFKTSAALDYTLFSVNGFATIQRFGTLFLDVRQAQVGERIYIPGHGNALPQRLSIHEETPGRTLCTVGTASLDPRNIGYSCDTSGGNSGSPVLAGSSHRVIALHHWGGCPRNGGVRIDLIHREIAELIDNNG